MAITFFRLLKCALATIFLSIGCCNTSAETLKQISVDTSKTNIVQIQFSFSSMPKYHQFVLSNPSRIVFDFADLEVKTPLESLAKKTNYIRAVRSAKRGNNGLRLVLDIEKGLKISTKKEKKQSQLILTLATKQSATKVESIEAPIPDVLLPFLKEYEAKAKQKVQPSYRDVVVVIDPGHGGKDPGASGARKTLEKQVVLQIARKLKLMVNKTRGMKAYLTRKGDYYVGLRQRLAIARKYKADIFVSIHADAFLNRRSRGASVYSLSQRGATSEAARWLAASENHSELGGVDLSDLDDDNGMIRSVLIDLSQTATNSASLTLGKAVLSGLDAIAKLHHDDVEQARFVVLKSPDIPSILVETGFISNAEEERLLASRQYQSKLARSILKGISHYFKEHPPQDSAMAQHIQMYKVVRGDTLSGIAYKFKVSMASIKKANHLSSNQLKIGQKLEIYL